MILSKLSALCLIIVMLSFCFILDSFINDTLAMPIIPFKGVLISWLILAKNSDFAWLALIAISLDWIISCSAILLWVTSRPNNNNDSSKSLCVYFIIISTHIAPDSNELNLISNFISSFVATHLSIILVKISTSSKWIKSYNLVPFKSFES